MSWIGRLRGLRLAPDAAEVDRQERSWAELRAGRLPVAAQDRLAAQVADHVFTSDLSTADLVALRAAGYEPVGQAFGAATYGLSTTVQGYTRYAIHSAPAAYGTAAGQLNGAYRQPPAVEPKLVPGYHDGVNSARAKALKRLGIECTGLGGDGVLGLRIEHSAPEPGVYQLTMIGTAVRHRTPTTAAAPPPFTTTLGAVDVGSLRAAGWRPTAMLYEHQRYGGHGGYVGTGGGRLNPLNYTSDEIPAGSTVIAYAGAQTRARLHARLPAGGGMILDRFDVALDREACLAYQGYTDFLVDVEAVGTAIEPVRPFTIRRSRPALDIRPVLRLG